MPQLVDDLILLLICLFQFQRVEDLYGGEELHPLAVLAGRLDAQGCCYVHLAGTRAADKKLDRTLRHETRAREVFVPDTHWPLSWGNRIPADPDWREILLLSSGR